MVVTGARQSGKTTLVRDILPRLLPAPLTYLTLDDPDERHALTRDPVRRLTRPGAITVLDEVQKLPGILDTVKLLADRPDGQQFILLGSSQILLLRQIRETLAGRAALLELWPLALAERTAGRAVPPVALEEIFDGNAAAAERLEHAPLTADQARAQRDHAERALHWGGFPPVLAFQDDADRRIWLRDYRRTYLERDVPDLGGIADLDRFGRAILLAAARTGQILHFADLARDLGVALNTARRYIHFLEISYQVVLLQPWLPNIGKRLVKSPKLYVADPGLARVLSGREGPTDGPLFETFVLSEILKWRSWQDDPPNVFYFRTHAGLEVDFVLARGGTIMGLECKASDRVSPADAGGLTRFLSDAAAQAPAGHSLGLVIYRGREVTRLARRVWAVPDWLLFGPRPTPPPAP